MHVTLVGTPTAAVHPVAVNVTSLAVAMTLWKGSMTRFLVQVGMVLMYECHNFCICLSKRDHQLNCSMPAWPYAIGSRSFGSLSLSLGYTIFPLILKKESV